MLQQLLRRLVFDVPLLSEYCKMPLKVNTGHYVCILIVTVIQCFLFAMLLFLHSGSAKKQHYFFFLDFLHNVLGMSWLN